MKKFYVDKCESLDPVNTFAITVQPPTFATIAEAYAYFTRHSSEYESPDYQDDEDTPPDFMEGGDTLDLMDSFYSSSYVPSVHTSDGPSQAHRAEPNDDGQRATSEPDGAQATEDD